MENNQLDFKSLSSELSKLQQRRNEVWKEWANTSNKYDLGPDDGDEISHCEYQFREIAKDVKNKIEDAERNLHTLSNDQINERYMTITDRLLECQNYIGRIASFTRAIKKREKHRI